MPASIPVADRRGEEDAFAWQDLPLLQLGIRREPSIIFSTNNAVSPYMHVDCHTSPEPHKAER